MKLPNSCCAVMLLLIASVTHAAPSIAPADRLAALPEAGLPVATVRQQIGALKHQPLRFAVPAALNLDQRNGAWDTNAAGLARWRLRIKSEGASSLALLLTDVQLPEGTTLWFYDAAGHDVQGPFDRDSASLIDGRLQLPLVRSSTAVLELLSPVAHSADVAFKITEAYHGYRNFSTTSDTKGNTPKAAIGNDSESCNVDVICPAGNDWRNEIRSTVLLSINSQTLCSGTLINNTRRDDRALILTANHCDIRDTNIADVRAYFNVQSSSCGGNDNGRVDQNIAGSTFLARDEHSDFTLFTLVSLPPSAYNVFYAGWDARTSIAPQSGVAVHHPVGDEKKISTYSTAAVAEDNVLIGDTSSGFNVDAWRIQWASGTTEPGSSGAGLFNQNKQVVGMLSGGNASCSTPTGSDFFGRFERAFTANTASSGQLKAHLDPINTGCLQLSSKNPGSSTPLASCTTAPTPTPAPAPTPVPNPDTNSASGGGLTLHVLALLLMGVVSRRKIAKQI